MSVLLLLYPPKNTWISMSIGAFEALFRAIDRANSRVQVILAVPGAISRYSEPTVGSKKKLLCGVIHVPQHLLAYCTFADEIVNVSIWYAVTGILFIQQ